MSLKYRQSRRGAGVTVVLDVAEMVCLNAAVASLEDLGSASNLIRASVHEYLSRRCPHLLGAAPTLFSLKKTPPRIAWDDFDGCVRAWAKDRMTLSKYLRPGRSPEALEVRFRHRAIELGLIQTGRDRKADDNIATFTRWLTTEYPTWSQRKIAQAYIDSNGRWEVVAKQLNVSRQRVHQVVINARGDMRMAEAMPDFPKSKAPDFHQWADGQVWKLKQGDDFRADQSLAGFAQTLRVWGIKRGLRLSTQRDLRDGSVFYVRFVPHEKPFRVIATEPQERVG